MLALNGIYDGKSVKLLEKFPEKRKFKVVVTFIEELEPADSQFRDFAANTKGLEFWQNPQEDIYQDYLLSNNNAK